jgi:hypothetical protein
LINEESLLKHQGKGNPRTYFVWNLYPSLNPKMIKMFWHQWLIPVILVTWEAEIGNIVKLASPGKAVARPHLNRKNLGRVSHTCHPSNG